MKPQANNIFIRNLNEFDQVILDELRVHFKETTNSQTTIRTLRNYKKLLDRVTAIEQLNTTLQTENTELRNKMNNLRNSLKDIEL